QAAFASGFASGLRRNTPGRFRFRKARDWGRSDGQGRVAIRESVGTIPPRVVDWFDIRNNAQFTDAGRDPRSQRFSNVEIPFRLRRRAQFSKFETNQLLVDKA